MQIVRYLSQGETVRRVRRLGERAMAHQPGHSSVKSIRALERGLDVLMVVRRHHGISLNDLHRETGLAKATLLRLLQTLASRALVWRRLADNVWVAGSALDGAREDRARLLAEAGSPLLVELTEKVVWPSVLAVPRTDHMEIVETNSAVARFEFASLGPIGAKLSYLHTATGRAYLAATTHAERESIIASVCPADATRADRDALDAIIAETRARGWSTRLPHHPWADRNRQTVLHDGKSSIAVAVPGRDGPIAAINVTWPSRRASVEDVAGQHLATLRDIAARIGRAVGQTG
jgi:IclR family mhp operon transcriptional activator